MHAELDNFDDSFKHNFVSRFEWINVLIKVWRRPDVLYTESATGFFAVFACFV